MRLKNTLNFQEKGILYVFLVLTEYTNFRQLGFLLQKKTHLQWPYLVNCRRIRFIL